MDRPPMNTYTPEMSDDAWSLEWLHRHRGVHGENITSLGRRWLTRVIWYFEEAVENDLRGKKKKGKP
jgi:hypothetical protein